jgi:hypothetical protein
MQERDGAEEYAEAVVRPRSISAELNACIEEIYVAAPRFG